MPDGIVLSEQDRLKLDGIVKKMIANKESEANINFVVNDFKNKYGLKKKRVFRIYFTKRCWGISYENYHYKYFIGYKATNKNAGFGYFRWNI